MTLEILQNKRKSKKNANQQNVVHEALFIRLLQNISKGTVNECFGPRNKLLCSKAERHLSPERSLVSRKSSADCFRFEEMHEMGQISGERRAN